MGGKVIRIIKDRLYQNYFMPSRIPEYELMLGVFGAAKYQFLTVERLADFLLSKRDVPLRTCTLRFDVDSDVETARAMFEVTRDIGAVATWYFRLATLDKHLMGDMQAAGHEVGYHFEELATVAKRRGIRRGSDLDRHLPEMRDDFCRNLETRYFPIAGSMPRTVASHGDFANRFLGQTNSCLINENIRQRYGIVAETSDPFLKEATEPRRFADVSAPRWWYPHDPTKGLPEKDLMYILLHPRQWRKNVFINTYLDVERVVDGGRYWLTRRFLHA